MCGKISCNNVYSEVDDKVLKVTRGNNSSTQVVVPLLDDGTISMIVEMGFSRERVE